MPKKYPKVKVKKSDTGLGLFAAEDIKKNKIIIEYTGERISMKEANKRGGRYLFGVTKKIVIDAKDRKHTARYINHACKPNAEAEHDTTEDRIFIRSLRKIKEGEEITYDYGKEYLEDLIGKKNCLCRHCVEKREKKEKKSEKEKKVNRRKLNAEKTKGTESGAEKTEAVVNDVTAMPTDQ
ncbi:MAG: SET domain-containing protein [Chitinophagales bacterium]|nr:SET domain-containing protein [Chitinophagales bacterium]